MRGGHFNNFFSMNLFFHRSFLSTLKRHLSYELFTRYFFWRFSFYCSKLTIGSILNNVNAVFLSCLNSHFVENFSFLRHALVPRIHDILPFTSFFTGLIRLKKRYAHYNCHFKKTLKPFHRHRKSRLFIKLDVAFNDVHRVRTSPQLSISPIPRNLVSAVHFLYCTSRIFKSRRSSVFRLRNTFHRSLFPSLMKMTKSFSSLLAGVAFSPLTATLQLPKRFVIKKSRSKVFKFLRRFSLRSFFLAKVRKRKLLDSFKLRRIFKTMFHKRKHRLKRVNRPKKLKKMKFHKRKHRLKRVNRPKKLKKMKFHKRKHRLKKKLFFRTSGKFGEIVRFVYFNLKKKLIFWERFRLIRSRRALRRIATLQILLFHSFPFLNSTFNFKRSYGLYPRLVKRVMPLNFRKPTKFSLQDRDPNLDWSLPDLFANISVSDRKNLKKVLRLKKKRELIKIPQVGAQEKTKFGEEALEKLRLEKLEKVEKIKKLKKRKKFYRRSKRKSARIFFAVKRRSSVFNRPRSHKRKRIFFAAAVNLNLRRTRSLLARIDWRLFSIKNKRKGVFIKKRIISIADLAKHKNRLRKTVLGKEKFKARLKVKKRLLIYFSRKRLKKFVRALSVTPLYNSCLYKTQFSFAKLLPVKQIFKTLNKSIYSLFKVLKICFTGKRYNQIFDLDRVNISENLYKYIFCFSFLSTKSNTIYRSNLVLNFSKSDLLNFLSKKIQQMTIKLLFIDYLLVKLRNDTSFFVILFSVMRAFISPIFYVKKILISLNRLKNNSNARLNFSLYSKLIRKMQAKAENDARTAVMLILLRRLYLIAFGFKSHRVRKAKLRNLRSLKLIKFKLRKKFRRFSSRVDRDKLKLMKIGFMRRDFFYKNRRNTFVLKNRADVWLQPRSVINNFKMALTKRGLVFRSENVLKALELNIKFNDDLKKFKKDKHLNIHVLVWFLSRFRPIFGIKSKKKGRAVVQVPSLLTAKCSISLGHRQFIRLLSRRGERTLENRILKEIIGTIERRSSTYRALTDQLKMTFANRVLF